ncbi:MAG: His/Gly/Thr/Pro-type tRNA ligase C-terminal domain-containing protein, partial [Synechococcaceae cyanobacterium]|nr:His/Gly/Thr/Pro-type tRNA ligase C-terminal domain-containing protein [Synechococcaceae cyanobacterium]
RYDGLVAQLGGPEVPGFGFAVGLDRLVMVLPQDRARDASAQVYIVVLGEQARPVGRRLALRLRHAGLRVALSPDVRSMKAQMRRADRSGARHALILGDDEVASGIATVKRLSDGKQDSLPLSEPESIVEVLKP